MVRVACLLSLAVLAAGCPNERGAPSGPRRNVARIAPEDRVVAEVNGTPITASRVASLSKLTGRAPSDVVDRLISFELLAQEARRRGLEGQADVRSAARKTMVRRYLELEFEARHRPEDMPEEQLRAAYQKNIGRFVHPQLRKVAHLLVHARDGRATEAQQREAFALAGEIAREAAKVDSLEEFRELSETFNGRQGFKVTDEVIAEAVYHGSRFAPNFVDAACELDEPGQVSRPAETNFGSHVIYLIELRQAIDRSFDEVREDVLENEYPYWVRRSFFEMMEEMRYETEVEGFEGQRRRVEAQ